MSAINFFAGWESATEWRWGFVVGTAVYLQGRAVSKWHQAADEGSGEARAAAYLAAVNPAVRTSAAPPAPDEDEGFRTYLDTTVGQVAKRISAATSSDTCFVFWRVDETASVFHDQHRINCAAPKLSFSLNGTHLGAIRAGGVPGGPREALADAAARTEQDDLKGLAAAGYRGLYSAPIRVEGTVVALLSLLMTSSVPDGPEELCVEVLAGAMSSVWSVRDLQSELRLREQERHALLQGPSRKGSSMPARKDS